MLYLVTISESNKNQDELIKVIVFVNTYHLLVVGNGSSVTARSFILRAGENR